MIAALPVTQPCGAAIGKKVLMVMDVILHIGAHRCATTSFQHYMRHNRVKLSACGIGFWGPLRTRSGLFRGLQPSATDITGSKDTQTAIARVQSACEHSQKRGLETLVVSDENMIGSMRGNLRFAELYSGAGERVARFARAFSGYLTDVALNIRSPEAYWTSTFGFFAQNGHALPSPALVTRIANAGRTWRDVITDVARAAPEARVHVAPFEEFAGRPDLQLSAVTGRHTVPAGHVGERHNRSPDIAANAESAGQDVADPFGNRQWMPFDAAQRSALRESYHDDLMWLTGGADGLARLASDPTQHKAGEHLPPPDMTEGRNHESRHRQVARTGRG